MAADGDTVMATAADTPHDNSPYILQADRVPPWFPHFTSAPFKELTSTTLRQFAIIWNVLISDLLAVRMSESASATTAMQQRFTNGLTMLNKLITSTPTDQLHPLLRHQHTFTPTEIESSLNTAIYKTKGALPKSKTPTASPDSEKRAVPATVSSPSQRINISAISRGHYIVPAHFEAIGGLDVLALDTVQLMKFQRHWNAALNLDTNTNSTQKWRLRLRVSGGDKQFVITSSLERILPLLDKVTLWRHDEQLNKMLPLPLQKDYVMSAEQKSQLLSPSKLPLAGQPPSQQPLAAAAIAQPSESEPVYQHGRHKVPLFITSHAGFDIADLTYSDLRYCIERWNSGITLITTSFAKIRPIDLDDITDDTQKNRLKLQDVFGERLYYFEELQKDPVNVGKLPVSMQPIAVHDTEKRQRVQPVKLTDLMAVDDNMEVIVKPSKPKPMLITDDKKKGDEKKTKADTSDVQAKYEFQRVQPSLIARSHYEKGSFSTSLAANNKLILGYPAVDVYRLVKIVYAYTTKHQTTKIDWTYVSELYLSTYYKLIPESECKLIWRYVAYNMNADGTVKPQKQQQPIDSLLRDDVSDDELSAMPPASEAEQYSRSNSGISQPWDIVRDEQLLECTWRFHEHYRDMVFNAWWQAAPEKQEYVVMFSTDEGRHRAQQQLSSAVYNLPPCTSQMVDWNLVAEWFTNLTGLTPDGPACRSRYDHLTAHFQNPRAQLSMTDGIRQRMDGLMSVPGSMRYRQNPAIARTHSPAAQRRTSPTHHRPHTPPRQLQQPPHTPPVQQQQIKQQQTVAPSVDHMHTQHSPQRATLKLQQQLSNRAVVVAHLSPAHPQQPAYGYGISESAPQLAKVPRVLSADRAAEAVYISQQRSVEQQQITAMASSIMKYAQLMNVPVDPNAFTGLSLQHMYELEQKTAAQYRTILQQRQHQRDAAGQSQQQSYVPQGYAM